MPPKTPPALDAILNRADVWQAKHWRNHEQHTVASGFPALDKHLPGGGWPQGAVTELLYEHCGWGELRLLLPALRQLNARQQGTLWVKPPYIPYAPALLAEGLDLTRHWLANPNDSAQQRWSMEQGLRNGQTVLAWVNAIKPPHLRRLQLAAEQGGSWLFLFRPGTAAQHSSPAALRLQLYREQHQLGVHIIKRRGGWPLSNVLLALEQPVPWLSTPVHATAAAVTDSGNIVQGPWPSRHTGGA